MKRRHKSQKVIKHAKQSSEITKRSQDLRKVLQKLQTVNLISDIWNPRHVYFMPGGTPPT